MTQNLILFQATPTSEYVDQALQLCNTHTAHDGLVLQKEDVAGLIKLRNDTLAEQRRIEFGEGPLVGLVAAFHDSPFLHQENYAESLARLQSAFYHLKEETHEEISDEDLIDAMRQYSDEKQDTADFFDEHAAEALKHIANGLNKDENEDFSEEKSYRFDKQAAEPTPETNRNELDRINEGGTHHRPDNEYANSFYEEFDELYRSGWDFNSRIGGSSL